MRLDEQPISLESLDKALAGGWRDGRWIESDPQLLPLRSQARFQELREHLRFYPLSPLNRATQIGSVELGFLSTFAFQGLLPES